MSLLDARFGDSYNISEAFRSRLEHWPTIKAYGNDALYELSDFVQQCLQTTYPRVINFRWRSWKSETFATSAHMVHHKMEGQNCGIQGPTQPKLSTVCGIRWLFAVLCSIMGLKTSRNKSSLKSQTHRYPRIRTVTTKDKQRSILTKSQFNALSVLTRTIGYLLARNLWKSHGLKGMSLWETRGCALLVFRMVIPLINVIENTHVESARKHTLPVLIKT